MVMSDDNSSRQSQSHDHNHIHIQGQLLVGSLDLQLICPFINLIGTTVLVRFGSARNGKRWTLLVTMPQVLPYPTHPQVQVYMDRLRLATLVLTWYPTTNKGLMNVIFERCHQETSSFHLPNGEMTITLNDVSCLLHWPMTSRPINNVLSLFNGSC